MLTYIYDEISFDRLSPDHLPHVLFVLLHLSLRLPCRHPVPEDRTQQVTLIISAVVPLDL